MKKLKTVIKWIIGLVSALAGAVLIIFTGKKLLEYVKLTNKVKQPTNWQRITETTISVYDKYTNMYRRARLPKDRRTGKQIKTSQIEAAGVTEKGGKVEVQIIHVTVDRRNITSNSTD